MIRSPRWRISADLATDRQCTADVPEVRERICGILPDVCRFCGINGLHVQVHDAVPLHHGLGAGTQLTLAVVTAAQILAGHPRPADSMDLAVQFHRVRRSAVGAFGFDRGGLIVDDGQPTDNAVRRLCSYELPDQWRVVLLMPIGESGLSGPQEESVFQERRTMTDATVIQQSDLIHHNIIPAAQSGNFGEFRDALGEFGRNAGRFFAAQQGGVYSSPVIRWLAEQPEFQDLQPAQSSWGPAAAVFAASEADAETVIDRIRRSSAASQLTCSIAEPLNCGATVRSVAPETPDQVVRG